MNFNKLGNTGLNVSSICLGTMTFGEQCTKKDSFDIDIDKLDQKLALDKDICAVLICNYQINTNIEEILKVTKKYKVEVILDCAISITSSLKKKSIVDYVNYSVFSFNLFKVIQSIHGGVVITSDNEFKDFLRNRQANWSIYNYRDLLNYFMKGVQIKILTFPLIYELFTFNLFKFGDLKNIKFIQNLSGSAIFAPIIKGIP